MKPSVSSSGQVYQVHQVRQACQRVHWECTQVAIRVPVPARRRSEHG